MKRLHQDLPLHLLLVCLALPALLSCRKASDESSRSVIGGQWGSVCLPIAGALPSIKIQYHFLDNHSVLRYQQFYRDASCLELAGELLHKGDFSLEVRSEINVYNIDMFFVDVHATPQTDEGVQLWNTLKFCGLDAWSLNGERDVLGNGSESCLSFATQRIEYRDVVQVLGEKTIIFGQSLGHLTPRPDSINAAEPSDIFSFISY